MSDVNLRPIATDDDRRACGDVFVEAFMELHRRQGYDDTSDHGEAKAFITEALEHFSHTDPELQWLAERDGEIIAFTSAWRRERYWFLAFLFVRPSTQSSGIGRALLEEVLPPEVEREDLTLATVIESTQPVSQALYARYGMVPRVPRPLLAGIPHEGALPERLPFGVEPVPLADVAPDEIEVFEKLQLGYSRGPHHARFDPGVNGFAFAYRRDGWLAGFGYAVHEPEVGLRIHPVVADTSELTAAIIGHLARRGGGGRIQLPVYGGASTLMPMLLNAGLRVASFTEEEHFPFLYCSTGPPPDADRVIPYAGFLP